MPGPGREPLHHTHHIPVLWASDTAGGIIRVKVQRPVLWLGTLTLIHALCFQQGVAGWFAHTAVGVVGL